MTRPERGDERLWEKVREAAEADLTVIGHTTLQHGQFIPSWEWTVSEVPKGSQPLTPAIVGPVEQVAAKMWPGVPVVPFMSAGATDGAFLSPAGIPTYGVSGMFGDPDGNGAHGLNERLRVSSVYKGRDFLYEVVKIYANQN